MQVNANQFMHEQSIHIGRISEKMSAVTEKRVIREYRSAMEDIKAQMASIYEKHSNKIGSLTYNEMTKYNRLDSMFNDMSRTLHDLNITKEQRIKSNSHGVFSEAYYRSGWTLENGSESRLNFGVLNPKVIQAAADNPISGLTLSETLKASRPVIITKARSTVVQGLLKGEPYSKMAKRIQHLLEDDATKAMRVVRTEGHRAAMQGQLAAVEHAAKRGVEFKKEWISTLDDRTRASHQGLDGQVVEKDADFISPMGNKAPAPGMFGVAAEDIQCRCDLGSVLPGAGNTTVRQTYKEWAKEHKIPVLVDENMPIKKATTAQLLEDLKNKIGPNRVPTVDELDEAGELVMRDLQEQNAALRSEYDEFLAKYPGGEDELEKLWEDQITKTNQALQKFYDAEKNMSSGEYSWSGLEKLEKEAKEAERMIAVRRKELGDFVDKNADYKKLLQGDTFTNSEKLKNYLGTIRPVGVDNPAILKVHVATGPGAKDVAEHVRKAYDLYPTDWSTASIAKGKITIAKTKRGYYSSYDSKIAISGYTNSGSFQTAIHELGHRFEDVKSKIVIAEKRFYDMRTKGESLQWLGGGYRKDELTRFDKFIDPYMGKDYGGSAYELVSMGFQQAYTDPTKLWTDPGYARFIYGVLSIV